MTRPLVSIVVLNYNGKELLEKFLPSILQLDYSPREILIVDNGSTDGSKELVLNNFSECCFIENEKNLGWSGGNAMGVQKCKGEYIWLLNNDVEVDKRSLKLLVELMEQNKEVGVVGPLVLCWPDKGRIQSNGFGFSRLGLVHSYEKYFENPMEVSYVSGCSMLIRRSVLEAIGGIDPTVPMYADDIDICLRCWIQGYSIVVVPSSRVYHAESATTARNPRPWFIQRSTEGRIRVMFKLLEWKSLVTAVPAFIAWRFLQCFYNGIRLRNPDFVKAYFIGVVRGIFGVIKIIKKRYYIQKSRVYPDKKFLKSKPEKFRGVNFAF